MQNSSESDTLFTLDGRFESRGELGRGAMGVVYRAYDRELARDVALKTLALVDPVERTMLKEEFRSLRNVVHPNVVQLEELFVEGSLCYFTMELLAGTDFVSAARGPALAGWNEAALERLPQLARQLAEGVLAVHAAGKIHGDIKPSNIIVTTADRVVVLDFGLASPRSDDPLRGGARGLSGTLPYMAPEQLEGAPASDASDAYAVGAVLFEALTGTAAFGGAPWAIAEAKQRPASRVSDRRTDVPAAIASLVDRLLGVRAVDRASLSEVMALFGGALERVHHEIAIMGRERDLATLSDIVMARAPAIVHVVGASGVGKTALVDGFLRGLGADTVVLRGYCHPREFVPFNALDAAVDELGMYLSTADAVADAGRVPDAELLHRLFPSLGLGTPVELREEDPRVLRRRGLDALRLILARIAAQRRLILWIDDIHWSDLDSVDALRALVSGEGASPMIVVLTSRSEDEESSAALSAIAHESFLQGSRFTKHTLRLEPLSETAARALAEAQVPQASPQLITAIVREAGGSPFFIGELARHATAASAETSLAVADVVRARLGQLEIEARQVLEVIALSARPLARAEVLAATALGDEHRSVLSRLERAQLLRRAARRAEGATRAEPVSLVYHARVREALVGAMDEHTLQTGHQRLLDYFEAGGEADTDVLTAHAVGARDSGRATRYAESSAERAQRLLAFSRAADLYELALAHAEPADSRRVSLQTRAADALKNAGRGRAAASRYVAASASMRGTHSDDEIRETRRRAAVELVRAGDLDEGLRIQREVLAELGIRLPRTSLGALAVALVRRIWLRFRGFSFTPRDDRTLSLRERVRLDTLWEAANSLGTLNFALADAPGTQHLVEALRSGDRSRAVRALAQEAAYEAHMHRGGNASRARQKLAIGASLLDGSSSSYDRAWHAMGSSMVSWASADWPAAIEHGQRALTIYRSECAAVSWEIGLSQLYLFSAAAFSGDLALLTERLDAALADALQRGDLNAANNYRLGQMSILRLCQDRVHEVLVHLKDAEVSWSASTFHTQRYHHLVLAVQAHLYRGEPEEALSYVGPRWRSVAALFFMQLVPWLELVHLRARAHLSAAARLGAPARHRRHVGKAIRALRREQTIALARPFADALEAGLAHQSGEAARSHELLERALAGFDACNMLLYREAVRFRLSGGASTAWMDAHGIPRPDRVANMLVPGFER